MADDNISTQDGVRKDFSESSSAFKAGYGAADTIANAVEASFGDDQFPLKPQSVMGMPLHWNRNADPNGRVYTNTIIKDAPMVSITPGLPLYRNKLFQGQMTKDDEDKMLTQITRLDENNADQVLNFIASDKTKGNALVDYRYYTFQPSLMDYFNYVQLFLSSLINKMGGKHLGGWDKILFRSRSLYEQWEASTIAFYYEKGSSVTESSQNQTAPSKLAGMSKSFSSIMREVEFIMGKKLTEGNIYDNADMVEKNRLTQSYLKDLTSGGFTSLFTGAGDSMQTLISGSQLLFPEIWQDSSFTKDINLNIKLTTPYGTPEGVFQYLYVPLVFLLCMALPRQNTMNGYGAPFIVRVDSPGAFFSDLAIINNISFKRGGSDDRWSRDGLPLEIDVNISIKDLYPALALTKQYRILRLNPGLALMIDNLAGLRMSSNKFMANAAELLANKLTYSANKGSMLDNVLFYTDGDLIYGMRERMNMYLGR